MIEQVKKLVLGNTLAQLLQFGSTTVLSRIYTPNDFGVLSLAQSIAMVASVIMTLQLHLIIPLSQNQTQAEEKLQKVILLVISNFLLMLLPAFWLEKSTTYALCISLCLSLTNSYTSYLVYQGGFRKISQFYIVRALLVIVLQISMAQTNLQDRLVLSTIAGEALAALYLKICANQKKIFNTLDFLDLKSLILKNKNFSIYGTIGELLSIAAFYSPLVIFNNKYGNEIGGQFAMASRLVWAPIVLLSSSMAHVLYHHYGKDRQDFSESRSGLPKIKAAAILLSLGLVSFLPTDMYTKLLGEQWVLAGKLIPWHIIWGIAFLISTPYRVMARALLMQKYQILVDIFFIILVTGFIFILPEEPIIFMRCIVFSAIIQHLLIVVFVKKKLKQFNPQL